MASEHRSILLLILQGDLFVGPWHHFLEAMPTSQTDNEGMPACRAFLFAGDAALAPSLHEPKFGTLG